MILVILLVFQTASFLKKKIDFDKNYIGYEIPKSRSIDIDDYEDFKLAEKIHETIKS